MVKPIPKMFPLWSMENWCGAEPGKAEPEIFTIPITLSTYNPIKLVIPDYNKNVQGEKKAKL